jgi:hypothetical protein
MDLIVTLSQWHYAEYRVIFFVMLSVIMLSVVMLNFVMLNVKAQSE